MGCLGRRHDHGLSGLPVLSKLELRSNGRTSAFGGCQSPVRVGERSGARPVPGRSSRAGRWSADGSRTRPAGAAAARRDVGRSGASRRLLRGSCGCQGCGPRADNLGMHRGRTPTRTLWPRRRGSSLEERGNRITTGTAVGLQCNLLSYIRQKVALLAEGRFAAVLRDNRGARRPAIAAGGLSAEKGGPRSMAPPAGGGATDGTSRGVACCERGEWRSLGGRARRCSDSGHRPGRCSR